MQIVNIYNRSLAVTKSDSVNIPLLNGTGPTGLQCGEAGVVVVVWEDGTLGTFTVAAGSILPFRIKRVNSTNTVGTLFQALYQI